MKVKVNGQIIMRGAFSASIKGLCKYIAAAGAHPAVFVVSLFLCSLFYHGMLVGIPVC